MIDEFPKGNPDPVGNLYPRRDHVALANPYCPPVRGLEQVPKVRGARRTVRRDGKSRLRERSEVGECRSWLRVALEQLKTKVGGREEITPYSLRFTTIFRPEDGEWKVVHRHADPITTPQPAESVIQE